jgi:transposase
MAPEKLLEMNYYGYEGKLTNLQEEELMDYLKKHMAKAAKEVVEYVRQRYNIEYTEKGMVDLLHRLGFVYKKTKLVPSRACSQKQESFVQEYERLKATKGPNDNANHGATL